MYTSEISQIIADASTLRRNYFRARIAKLFTLFSTHGALRQA